MTLKLLVIWRLLTVGGVNAGWRNRAVYFKQHGIETEFLYNKDHGGVHIMQDVARIYLTKDRSEILSILNHNQYDAVIVVDTGDAYRLLGQSSYRGPIIVEARTPELLKLSPHLKGFEGLSPIAMITPSKFERRLASILVHELPIHVVYNGIDTTFFRPLSDEEIDFSHEPIVTPGKKIVGWIGRLDKRKNWRMLLQVATLVLHKRDDVEFWVIGGAESSERDLFAAEWGRNNMSQAMKWFPVIPYQQMPHMYAKIRDSGGCTLATTKAESFGNTFIESMACGVPVVAPMVSSIPEIVVHGKTGLLFRDSHVREATRQIYRLLDNEDLHTRMSTSAVGHVQRNFSIPVVGETYVRLLNNLVDGPCPCSTEVTPND
jgi:L-malate glycosyltransferase